MNMLVLVISTASKTPSVIGQGKQVLYAGRVGRGPVQALDPLLAQLECCKAAPVGTDVKIRELQI